MSLIQLDLFGNPVEPTGKKAASQKVIEEKAPEATPLAVVSAPEANTPAETKQQPAEPIIFNDGKINIKIKPKAVATVNAEPDQTKKANALTTTKVAKATAQSTPPVKGKRGRKSFKEIDAALGTTNIPEDEVLFQKLYYPISEVAKWFNVNASLIRFWEKEFDILKPRKNRKGDRLFRPEDVKNLELIYALLREKKYTVEGAKEYIKSHKKQADVHQQLNKSLTKFKSFLLELKANLGTS